MACRGVHFALTEKQYKKIQKCDSDDDLIEFIQEDIEEDWDEGWLIETDKAWDAIHRCLTDGKLDWNNGSFPLNAVILGGKQLHKGDDYIVSLVTPNQVSEIAKALKSIDKGTLKLGYKQIDPDDYDADIGEEDFQYTWSWFKGLIPLYEKAGSDGRAVIFTVDQ